MEKHMRSIAQHSRSGKSLVGILAVLAILLGGLLGPLQAVYCVFLSGKEAGEYPIQLDQPVTVPLSPDMNPIRFNASMQHEQSRSITTENSRFDGTLSLADKEIWTETFSASSKRDKKNRKTGITIGGERMTSATTTVHSFDVTESGDYQFVVHQTRDDLRVEDISIVVRRNVRQVNVASCVAGFAMLLLGIGGGIFAMVKAGKRKSA